ncbi:matrixin family metalloprotease [Arthrobacter sp. HY1533]|uniref:matrixin family metalloprotease n=1 Tax=Arthrobacter sp. HY1533 TaxID=2970919 RepID=UPI0022BA0A94|nr:matrixin family metalloprotease [Arthrobacter sp. HY1533]
MSGPDPQDSKRLPSSPSGRTPQWVHDEEVRRLVSAMHGNEPVPPRRSGRRRRHPARILLTVLLVLFVAVAGTWYAAPSLAGKITAAIVGEQFTDPAQGAGLFSGGFTDFPPHGVEAQKEPLGSPPPVAEPNDSYSFIHSGTRQDPIAYDPCRPIHYVTRPDNAPPGAAKLVADAVAAASKASGFEFIDDGATDESFDEKREPYQPERYGKRWAPVLIVWETVAEEPQFTLDVKEGDPFLAGLGGSQGITGDQGSTVFVTGTVQLNAEGLAKALAEPTGAAGVGAVIQHELGHVLGLGHVQDATQLMYEHGQQEVTTFAAGDLTGLSKLAQGKCFPNH